MELIFCRGSCVLRHMQMQTVIAMTRLTSIISIWQLKGKKGWWLQVKKYLNDKFGIQVHFSGHHNSYSAYEYVIKEDSEAVHPSGHPD